MPSLVRLVAASFVVAVAAPVLSAQAHPLAGRWEIDFERGRRMEDGEVTSIRGKANLTLELRGDSLVGTLEVTPAANMPKAEPQRFAGKLVARGAVFVVKSVVTVNINGAAETKEAVTTWTLEAAGDALEGTSLRTFSGMETHAEPAAVKGVRVK